ncbi:N-acetylmuramoyl-L-alanine amidase family protein [Ihubacter sp. mB4P-1]|uniref:peptidoglycan recognition protein family protein n=1 Tax=Ihubacter sp. mB4P-1 TaxID=3242370 RepID=UPI00137ABD44
MKIIESILTKNPCYTTDEKITVKGIMLHSVGCAQPDPHYFIDEWDNPNYDRACVHGFIDAYDGTIYQTLPWNHRGWHAGGLSNDTHIGIEMCEPDCLEYTDTFSFICHDPEKSLRSARLTYTTAVDLTAYLCKIYDLNPLDDGVIISHYEGFRRAVASDHEDPEHYWDQLHTGYTMEGFRADVASKISNI